MTSRNVSRKRLEDSLDVMIRWVLRDRLCDVTPPAGMWERISERLVQQHSVNDVARRQGLRLAAQGVGLWLLAVSAVGARSELPHHGLQHRVDWKPSLPG